MLMCNQLDHLFGAYQFAVLWEENAAFTRHHKQRKEFAQIVDMQHAALVRNRGEEGELLGEFGECEVVAFAVFSVNHRGTNYRSLESGRFFCLDGLVALPFTVAVEVRGGGDGVGGDDAFLVDVGCFAVDDNAAHENELLDLRGFGDLGGFLGEVGVDLVVLVFSFLGDVADVCVGNAGDVENGVVCVEFVLAPVWVLHVEGVDQELAGVLFGRPGFERLADVAIGAGDEDAAGWGQLGCGCLGWHGGLLLD